MESVLEAVAVVVIVVLWATGVLWHVAKFILGILLLIFLGMINPT